MAEWIPRCKGLSRKREVIDIARTTGLGRRVVADLLCDFWDWADAETDDGFLPRLTVADLPAVIPETDGAFWLAVVQAGWLAVAPDGLTIPNFDRWMGRNAKSRLKEREKKRQQRAVPKLSPKSGDKTGTTRQDKTRQKRNTPPPPPEVPACIDTPEFRAAWDRWLTYRRGRRLTCRAETLQEQLALLASLGPARAVASLTESIRNGWQGVFPPKGGRNGQAGDLFAGQREFLQGGSAGDTG
ncbi:MAG: hypothetical protein IT429_14940 [Gemmataceae bacterium]|nr:hypothetical protein [Gemmataceae bacterium]